MEPTRDGNWDRTGALLLLPPELVARIADHLMERALIEPTECRYCGVKPGQEMPRPSYFDMRTLLAEVAEERDGRHGDLWDRVDAMVAHFGRTHSQQDEG